MNSKVGIGIIGCGRLARNTHLPRLAQMDHVAVLGAMDIVQEHAREAAERYDIDMWTTDLDELLARKDIDAVLVASWTHAHAEGTIRAAQAGKHVFCEKPIAPSLKDADAMISACQDAGVKLMVGFVRRFDNEWLKLRELIRKGVIGRPVVWRSVMARGSGDGSSWFMQKGQGGGTFVDLGVHHFDFARFTFGEPAWAFGSTQVWQPKATAADTGTAVIKFEADDELALNWSWGIAPGCSGAHLHDVIGPGPGVGGAILFPEPAFYRVSMQEPHGLTVDGPAGKQEFYPYERNDIYADELHHFVQCVLNDTEPKVGGQDGKRALEMALAVLDSGQKEQVIRF
jgi:UDP-N-acetylglucosamine 3-dehydrogenase